jgi:membrane protease YdiL (CAAX protease family)
VLIVFLMAGGAVAVAVAWLLVRADRVSVFPAMALVLGAAALAALASGRVSLSPRIAPAAAAAAGVGAGVGLYAATVGFVLLVRRWPFFDRHVAGIYDQRRGYSLGGALVIAALVVAPAEELFWRGLVQTELADDLGWVAGSVMAWAIYVVANAASGSLAILAGTVVSGAVWGALALWSRGVLSSIACHAVWTALMIVWPPGGPGRRPSGTNRRARSPGSGT